MVATITSRSVKASVEWNDVVERALLVALGNAVMNIRQHPHVPTVRGSNMPHISVTINGDLHHEWEAVRVIVGRREVEEVLLAKVAENNKNTEYMLIVRGYGERSFSGKGYDGYVVPLIATVHRPNGQNWCFGEPPDWLDDWDEAYVRLREEAIMRQMVS